MKNTQADQIFYMAIWSKSLTECKYISIESDLHNMGRYGVDPICVVTALRQKLNIESFKKFICKGDLWFDWTSSITNLNFASRLGTPEMPDTRYALNIWKLGLIAYSDTGTILINPNDVGLPLVDCSNVKITIQHYEEKNIFNSRKELVF